MVIKGSRRAGSHKDAQALLDHLLRGQGNEHVREITGPGSVADLINDARAFATGGRDHAVWHLSINPEIELTEAQWIRARVLILEGYKARPDLPVACVQHSKPHRRSARSKLFLRPTHEHVTFSTTDPLMLKQIDPYYHYVINERICRQLEFEFGHPLVKGKFNDQVHVWFRANGLDEIADAMKAAELLDEPAVSKVSDRERQVALRTGWDPFLAMDASTAALAIAERAIPESRGRVIRQHYADEGFVLARGDSRLVLVPVDGRGKPVSVSRKAGIKEATFRELLGYEYERLPVFPNEANVSAWLHSLAVAVLAPPTSQPQKESGHGPRSEDNPELHHRPAPRHQSRSGSRRAASDRSERADRDRVRSDPGRDHDRPGARRDPRVQEADGVRGEPAQPDASAAPDTRERGADFASRSPSAINRSRPDAGKIDRPTKFEQARLTQIAEQHLGQQHRGVLTRLLEEARQPPDPVRVEYMAKQIIKARYLATDVVRASKSPVIGVELAESRLSMTSGQTKLWILQAIRCRYDTGWLPHAVVANIVDYRYDRQAEEVVLTLQTGAVIRDGMTRISLEGIIDEISVDELVAAVKRRGWISVNLTGTIKFQRAAALCLALLDPPITIAQSQLSTDDWAEIDAALRVRLVEQSQSQLESEYEEERDYLPAGVKDAAAWDL